MDTKVDNSMIKEEILAFPLSPIFIMNQLQQQLIAEGKNIYKMGFGQSPFPPPKCMIEELGKQAHQKDYLHVQGLFPLRAQMAKFYQKYTKYEIDPNQIVIGPGSIENLFVFQAVFKGNLITPNPTWVSYGPQAKLARNNHYWVPAYKDGQFNIDLVELEALLIKLEGQNNYLFLNYPSNPTGTTLNKAELTAIADICRKHGCYVVSDEIYCEQNFTDEGHTSMAEIYPEKTVISNGISKWLGAGGWRIGFMIIPKEMSAVVDAMNMYNSEINSGVSSPIQWATIKGFEDTPEMTEYFANSKAILKTISGIFRRHLVDAGIASTTTGDLGSYYVLMDFTNQPKAVALRAKYDQWEHKDTKMFGEMVGEMMLEEEGLALLHASAFGLPKEELFFRVSFADFDGGALLEMAKTEEINEEFVKRECSKLFEGLQVLITWWTVTEVKA